MCVICDFSILPDNVWMVQFFEQRYLPDSGGGHTLTFTKI